MIKDRKFQVPKGRKAEKLSRAIRSAAEREGWDRTAKKNIAVARFVSANGKKRLNQVLRSAGMGGGLHPRGIHNRTAAHTEPQLAALLVNPHFKKYLRRKLGTKHRVEHLYSSNMPCSSAGGGSAEGCGGMDESAVGSPREMLSTTGENYVGGRGFTQAGALRALGPEDDTMSVGSEDTVLGEEEVRGKDLTSVDLWEDR